MLSFAGVSCRAWRCLPCCHRFFSLALSPFVRFSSLTRFPFLCSPGGGGGGGGGGGVCVCVCVCVLGGIERECNPNQKMNYCAFELFSFTGKTVTEVQSSTILIAAVFYFAMKTQQVCPSRMTVVIFENHTILQVEFYF
jgi:hypothetical protein